MSYHKYLAAPPAYAGQAWGLGLGDSQRGKGAKISLEPIRSGDISTWGRYLTSPFSISVITVIPLQSPTSLSDSFNPFRASYGHASSEKSIISYLADLNCLHPSAVLYMSNILALHLPTHIPSCLYYRTLIRLTGRPKKR